ncbi:beta-1,4-galactosyltransferase galt-1 isoform X1 [Anopheles merus]|uniref:beta-1,4-galactosyltransferase galt-1 isoform X1 n=1 Tax=Anopheles merus TaxID=30066 RepID=UPI001BE42096|nr:beta-1,4-galactosyltransferase galt-1 isoform X1 [Anopheles merus]
MRPKMVREISYISIKSRSKPVIFVHSLVSNRFTRKYGVLSLILLTALGLLYYRRVLFFCDDLQQKYIHQTLPLYQRSVSLTFGNESWLQGEDTGERDRWLPIGEPKKRFKIYSAYFDPRLEVVESFPTPDGFLPFGSVRIFAILPFHVQKGDIFCNFRSDNTYVAQHQADRVEAVHEHWKMEFAASYVICKLAGNITKREARLPDEVALSYLSEPSMREATSFVRIKYPTTDRLLRSAPTRSLAVCVGPMHHDFAHALRVVEFFEYYQMNGAERFYVYNKSATPEVDTVLRHYQASGLVQVLDWHFEGYKFESELRYEGIFVALNDCFYRATIAGGFKYTAIVDFDELLFPTSDNETLLEYLQTKDRYDVHSFNFQGVFFYDIYSPDFSKVPPWANNTYLYTQVRNVRTKNPLLHHNRSKYVLKGRNVLEAGNHFVWKAVRDTHEYAVPENEGLLMHYRDGSLGYDFENVVLDNRVRERFGDAIWRRVNAQCALIFPETTMCPLGEHYTRTASVR